MPAAYAVKYLARSSRVAVRERFANEKLSTEVCGSVDDGPESWVFADMIVILLHSVADVKLIHLCACLFTTWFLSSPGLNHDRNHTIWVYYCFRSAVDIRPTSLTKQPPR